ncbi:MAG: DUF4230 domain-containing protein [Sphingopyxis sp.]|jgi:hypothetical protein|uniref:DUF4230 domain-containing protein n=1 Tax=unclassified Sphingopyxis TaxID=2614943 RepID=UPI0007307E8A|nr:MULTISPECIES: DUF4230 domain-containing protein [unclassified Sphingopyxis]KTE01174.1 hypothetical protein ATE78_15815 [Sphingopyxis sp. H012]KTE12525.1 hypothetical protein ATE70_04440 [Sphingopyxis sp. H053]KTE14224.1 hypothetical protein ATE76_09600 [Sphingopyxis sp. H093]KTE18126.1 hypothetical protein ATE75_23380 [Sphingopyxis sp. H080]KTE33779.1 hypothetical protein ATE73_23620 [Sphingopyxis sp. H077]
MTSASPARLAPRLILLAAAALLLVAVWWAVAAWQDWQKGYDPETVVAASLQGLQEQNVLVPFTARYVAVVTSTQSRLGLSAKKTLIMPGTVRYELDLGKLKQSDLDWDAATNALTVTLPPLRLAGPEIDIDAISEYRDGEILLTLTDAERTLDAANRKRAQEELIAQAKGATPMRLAQGAARTAVEQSFAMPLKAAGIDAKVTARFADAPSG